MLVDKSQEMAELEHCFLPGRKNTTHNLGTRISLFPDSFPYLGGSYFFPMITSYNTNSLQSLT
jgi:hypothetical protein